MKIRVLSLEYALVITVCISIVTTLGNPRPNYFDRNENPELSQWAEQHQEQVHEMANRLRTEYNRAITHHSGEDGGTAGCKTTCIPSTTWVSYTGKTQEEINQLAKQITLQLVDDLNSGKIAYHQISQPNWFENYAAHELHNLQNQHYRNNFGAQIHIPQGNYYHKTEKKQVFEYKQEGGNIQPTFIYKPSVTTFEEKKQETREHSSSGYPTVYYGHGQTVEKIEKHQEEHEDFETNAHVPVYTDSYFHSSDRKGHNTVNRRPTVGPAIHVSYNNREGNEFAQNMHNVYPTAVPVSVSHKEQHMATVEKQTIPIIYKYGNNEHRTEQTQHRNRTSTYRRPSTTVSTTTTRKNTTTTQIDKKTRRPTTVYSGKKHGIYKHLKIDDGNVPNYKPRVVHKESIVRDTYGFGEEPIILESEETNLVQNHTMSATNQQNSGVTQINYRPAYVGHQSRYNRTHGHNYTRPGYIIPGQHSHTSHSSHTSQSSQQASRPGFVVTGGGNSQTVQTAHSNEELHQTRPGYAIVATGGNSQAIETSKQIKEVVQNTKPGYVVVTGGSGQTSHLSESSHTAHNRRPGYVITTGGGAHTVETSHSSQMSQQGGRPGYVVVTGGGGSQKQESSHTSHTSQHGSQPGYVIAGGGGSQIFKETHSSQSSQQGGRPGYVVVTGGGGSQTVDSSHTSHSSQQGTRPGYIIAGGGGTETVETTHSQNSHQGGRPGYVVVSGGGGTQTIETSQISETSQQGSRPGYIITGGGNSQTVEKTHTSQTSQQGGRPGYVVVTGGGGSQTVESSHTSQTSQQGSRPGYIISGGGGSQTVETSHSSETTQGGRPGFLVVTGSGGSQIVESTYVNQTSQKGTRPGYIVTGGGGQSIQTSHSSQSSEQSGRPGYVVVAGGGASQIVESSHKNESTYEVKQPQFVMTGVGSSQIIETTHSTETLQQGGRPGMVVVVGSGGSQILEYSEANQTTQQGTRPGYIITGGGGQTIQTTHSNHSSQQSGRPGYVVVAGGGGSQTVESSHTSHSTQQGTRPGYVITGGGQQTIETSHTNETSQHNRPGYIVSGGGGSQTIKTTLSNQTEQHMHPGYVISGGSQQFVETTNLNQSAQETSRPGYIITTGGGSQTIESTQTNQASQHSRPGYVVVGSGGQSTEISQTNQSSQQFSKPGYIITGGGSEAYESNQSSQTSEQSSRPGYVITGGGGSQTSQASHSNHSEQETRPGVVVIGGGGQSSQIVLTNQTSEQSSRPGYIITGGGSQTVETTHTNQNLQENRPGYVVVAGGGSQTIQSSLSNQTSEQSNSGLIGIAGGSFHNYSQEIISQSNQTGGSVHIADGSYISGHGIQEIDTNWTSSTSNKKPYVIISKDRGDQPPHTFEDYYDSEEILEKEPGIGFYPAGVKPEIGLLVPGQPPKIRKHDQYESHSSHSHSSHHNHRNHQANVYPGSTVTTTHTHTIGTLPGDSKPLLEHHHVDKQLEKEGSSHIIHSSQSNIRENEIRESHGFNKSKHHHESDKDRQSGTRHGQHYHTESSQHHSGSQHHGHRHHHGEQQTGYTGFSSHERRQNVSRQDHEERMKTQVNHFLANFAKTVERDIQNIHPEEDKEEMQKEIVYDNMEYLLLQINHLVGNDPDTKRMIENLVENELQPYREKYRVRRSLINLKFGSQPKVQVEANLEQELLHTGLLSGFGHQPVNSGVSLETKPDLVQSYLQEDLSEFQFTNKPKIEKVDTSQLGFESHTNVGGYQETQTEDLSHFSAGLSHQPNSIPTQKHSNNVPDATVNITQTSYDLTQETQMEDLSQFSMGLGNPRQLAEIIVSPEKPATYILNNNPGSSNIQYGDHETLKEDFLKILGNNPESQNVNPNIIISSVGKNTVQRTCCWKAGNPNYQPIGSKTNIIDIQVGPTGEKIQPLHINQPVYQPINNDGQTLHSNQNSTYKPINPEPKSQPLIELGISSKAERSKLPLLVTRLPGVCCWYPGSPNYQPIGSNIKKSDINTGPVSQKAVSVNHGVPIYKSLDKPLSQITVVPTKLATSQDIQGPTGSPNYISIGPSNSTENVATVGESLGYDSSAPCQSTGTTPVNPVYTPIAVLQQITGGPYTHPVTQQEMPIYDASKDTTKPGQTIGRMPINVIPNNQFEKISTESIIEKSDELQSSRPVYSGELDRESQYTLNGTTIQSKEILTKPAIIGLAYSLLDMQTSYDLTQQTQTEDLSEFSSGFGHQPVNSGVSLETKPDLVQNYLQEDLSEFQFTNKPKIEKVDTSQLGFESHTNVGGYQETQTEDLSHFSAGLSHQPNSIPTQKHSNNVPDATVNITQTSYDLTQETQMEDLSQFSMGLGNPRQLAEIIVSPEKPATYILNNNPGSSNIQYGDHETLKEDFLKILGNNPESQNVNPNIIISSVGKNTVQRTCCWKAGNPNYQPIGSKTNIIDIQVGPTGEKIQPLHINQPVYQPINNDGQTLHSNQNSTYKPINLHAQFPVDNLESYSAGREVDTTEQQPIKPIYSRLNDSKPQLQISNQGHSTYDSNITPERPSEDLTGQPTATPSKPKIEPTYLPGKPSQLYSYENLPINVLEVIPSKPVNDDDLLQLSYHEGHPKTKIYDSHNIPESTTSFEPPIALTYPFGLPSKPAVLDGKRPPHEASVYDPAGKFSNNDLQQSGPVIGKPYSTNMPSQINLHGELSIDTVNQSSLENIGQQTDGVHHTQKHLTIDQSGAFDIIPSKPAMESEYSPEKTNSIHLDDQINANVPLHSYPDYPGFTIYNSNNSPVQPTEIKTDEAVEANDLQSSGSVFPGSLDFYLHHIAKKPTAIPTQSDVILSKPLLTPINVTDKTQPTGFIGQLTVDTVQLGYPGNLIGLIHNPIESPVIIPKNPLINQDTKHQNSQKDDSKKCYWQQESPNYKAIGIGETKRDKTEGTPIARNLPSPCQNVTENPVYTPIEIQNYDYRPKPYPVESIVQSETLQSSKSDEQFLIDIQQQNYSASHPGPIISNSLDITHKHSTAGITQPLGSTSLKPLFLPQSTSEEGGLPSVYHTQNTGSQSNLENHTKLIQQETLGRPLLSPSSSEAAYPKEPYGADIPQENAKPALQDVDGDMLQQHSYKPAGGLPRIPQPNNTYHPRREMYGTNYNAAKQASLESPSQPKPIGKPTYLLVNPPLQVDDLQQRGPVTDQNEHLNNQHLHSSGQENSGGQIYDSHAIASPIYSSVSNHPTDQTFINVKYQRYPGFPGLIIYDSYGNPKQPADFEMGHFPAIQSQLGHTKETTLMKEVLKPVHHDDQLINQEIQVAQSVYSPGTLVPVDQKISKVSAIDGSRTYQRGLTSQHTFSDINQASGQQIVTNTQPARINTNNKLPKPYPDQPLNQWQHQMVNRLDLQNQTTSQTNKPSQTEEQSNITSTNHNNTRTGYNSGSNKYYYYPITSQNNHKPIIQLEGYPRTTQTSTEHTTPETNQLFRENPEVGDTSAIQSHLIEKQQNQIQPIAKVIPKPKLEVSYSDHRRGGQTAFDDLKDYDGVYEPQIMPNHNVNDKVSQNVQITQIPYDYMQYTDSDAELQQLTQKLTKEDFTDFVKSHQRSKRQIVQISGQTSKNNEKILISAESDNKSVGRPKGMMFDYQNHPRNFNHI